MRVGDARAAAADWVFRYAQDQPGFRGAYLSGSTISLSDDAELPATSDVDVLVVTAATSVDRPTSEDAPTKVGKLRHRGVLLDIGSVPEDRLRTPEQVLGCYRLAGSFRTDRIIADPTGWLHRLQVAVAADFARYRWVSRRCEEALRIIEERLAGLDSAAPFHQQVTGWLFAAGGTVHLPLVAALRNPTVRLRYLAAREVLAGYRLDEHYRPLLELLGCADLARDTVARQLDDLARTFDVAAAVARTTFAFSSDVTPVARYLAMEGSRQLIERGDHREAVFWIVATYARCHAILAVDAPDLHWQLAPAFRATMTDLGIGSPADIECRAGLIRGALPGLRLLAAKIMSGNPEVVG
jgi:hypothetical protein